MDTIRLIIAGSRDFNNYPLLEKEVDNYLLGVLEKIDKNIHDEYLLRILVEEDFNTLPIEIVSGTARGGDWLGEQYAKKRNLPIKYFTPNWSLYHRSAGYIRNEEMAKYSSDAIIFILSGSKGSTHMAKIAKKYNLGLKVINL
jgi:hypothetical protein